VIYKSRLKEGAGYHFLVFHDSDRNVFYVQVKDTRTGVHLNEYHSPFDGDPARILKLKGDPAEASRTRVRETSHAAPSLKTAFWPSSTRTAIADRLTCRTIATIVVLPETIVRPAIDDPGWPAINNLQEASYINTCRKHVLSAADGADCMVRCREYPESLEGYVCQDGHCR